MMEKATKLATPNKSYQRTKEDDVRDEAERRWKEATIQKARADFMRKYPTGRLH